eukprot:1641603-Pleurochrysis_carterae.AAC.1
MLDVDSLGEVNNSNGLPGLHDQVPCMYTVELPICTRYVSLFARVAWVLGTSPPAARRGTWSGTARYGSFFAVHDAIISETFVRFRMPFLFRCFAFCFALVWFLRVFRDPRYPRMAAD